MGSQTKKPWGEECVLLNHNGHKIKIITISPGHRTSLQYHQHRKEYLMLLEGRGILIRRDHGPMRSIYGASAMEIGLTMCIEPSIAHRLRNPDECLDMKILEVQMGNVLDDDDIVRLEDDYGRA